MGALMSKPQVRLTAELIEAICTRIKAGAFEWVAVESLGVPQFVYQEWLNHARRSQRLSKYHRLATKVMQARAQARLRAEMEVRDKDVKVWLLQGPGRETATHEGWGPAAKPAAGAESAEHRVRLGELCHLLLRALAPFPEARAAVAKMLESGEIASHERQRVAGNDIL
jgi:hypothetical protein